MAAAESVSLEVTATDACGNAATEVFDPATDPPDPCERTLDDGTCCPAVARPAGGESP